MIFISRDPSQGKVHAATNSRRELKVDLRELLLCMFPLILLSLLIGCRSANSLPKPGSKAYTQFVSAFYIGLAGLQVGDDVRAQSSLSESTKLAPGEPAAWVNWGVLALRQRAFDSAAERFTRAQALAPANGQISYLLGLLESERGNSAAAIAHLQLAVVNDHRNVRALYQLASEVERQGEAGSEQQFEELMRRVLAIDPANPAAELELSRVAAKLGDVTTLKTAVSALSKQNSDWPAEANAQLKALQIAAESPQPQSAATRSLFLRNVLMRVPSFRDSVSDLKPAPGEEAQPMTHFLRLPTPPSRPAGADRAMTFEVQRENTSEPWSWAGALLLNGEDAPVLAHANVRQVHLANGAQLPFPGGSGASSLFPESILPVDFNYDFKVDLVLAGQAGVRFYRQDTPSSFTEVTQATRLPATVLQANYTGAWALDIEADGDLDVLLGAASMAPTVLRNNGDGSFAVMHPFPGISGVRQLAWADLNGDGNPDAAILDGANRLHIFLNHRSATFIEATPSTGLGEVKAITVANIHEGQPLSLLAVKSSGEIVRLTSPDEGHHWTSTRVAEVRGSDRFTGDLRLYAEDLDNNGAVDLIVSCLDGKPGTHADIWLQDENGEFVPLGANTVTARVFGVSDLKGNGHLALVGLGEGGTIETATVRSEKNYRWQTIRPRARQATGDQRINSFGIGGEIEIRSGLLVQTQPIRSPALHFGLGEARQADVARILWPNGSVRAEFGLKTDQQIVTEQRLKGSCPFLFAWDGRRMNFVKDSVPWGSAIGLRINALGAAQISATEEWYKIGRDQLQARDGFYDLAVTGELWETYYYDSMTLMTVDHPADTEIFADERFAVPAVKLAATPMAKPQPLTRAVDDNGNDVTSTLKKLDGVYLDTFGRGQYQGITRDHYVEIALPDDLPTDQPLWLIAKGWLHPSDSSINVALAQGRAEKPHWLSLEALDRQGVWRTVKPNLGFPAGRNKICLIDLAGVFAHGQPHRVRLRTNLEVYWDQIEWAAGLPATPLHIQRLLPANADLHYRGFSTIEQVNASSPELPRYDRLSGTAPRWRDLSGFYTRFGDVRELLSDTDDRYVIMNAGDEMTLRYAAPPPPPPGWVRDFIIAGDGWIKDGDYNSSHSQTVLPYPHHARRDYNQAPGELEDDWVFTHHAMDWQTYQTRYVTPHAFVHALRGNPGQ